MEPLSERRAEARSTESSFLELVRRGVRGNLKLYIGSAAGTGKTYRMLQEAHDLRRRGVDVVIGFVETHGRAETEQQMRGLKLVPRRRIEYRGVALEEMDLDAVVARHPEVAIVDELAHTNVPGSRNAKRWQDVLHLLDEGINVVSAVNIQHLESLNDVIQSTLGVTVRETVPDWVVGQADQVVNLDISAEDLRQRLREGKIYRRDKIELALTNFFTDENLTTLRELALREVASSVDRARERIVLRETNGSSAHAPKTVDRVMACLSSDPPLSRVLLRRASRIAGRLNSDWYCVYVQTAEERPDQIDATLQRRLVENIQLAQSMGAEVVKLEGDDVATALGRFASERGVTLAVIGETRRSTWYRMRRGSLVHRLLASSVGLDVLVVSGREQASLAATPSRMAALDEPHTPDAAHEIRGSLGGSQLTPAGSPAAELVMRAGEEVARWREESTVRAAALREASARLNEVRIPLQILLETPFGQLNENQEELLRDARSASDAMDVALRRLALVAGDGDDEASTKREWIPVNEVVRAVLPLARAAAERRGTRVELSLEPGLPRVLADRASFAEALTLLVTECAGRSDADHPLRVATARDTATALVTITPPLPTGTGASETQATTWIVAKRLLERDSGTLSNEPEGVLLRFSTA